MVEVLPPHLPLELELPADAGEVLQRLKRVWLRATPDSIGRDLETARRIASVAPSHEAEMVQRYLNALERLERWLRDV